MGLLQRLFYCCGTRSKVDYDNVLADSEREAVADLLTYLENAKQRAETDFFSGEPLNALSTLVYSQNIDLQRSASLTFAEITERATNKVLIVSLGGLTPLIRQMNSPNVEVQCNAVGCITNLATHEDNKARIARSGALAPLTRLAKSKDMRVQRNATGALLNMTHSDDNRNQLVSAGAIPVLVSLLSSPDTDVQYYCTTALSNIAVDATNRKRLAQTESKLVQSLVQLMKGQAPKVQCQAALALRNLASDEKYQLEIVRAGGLSPLLGLLQSSYLPLILSAVACIRNISIHPMNESPIIDAGFLRPLVELLGSTDNEEIQCHAISTLRNLAASSDRNKQLVLDAGAVQKCKELVLDVPLSVQSEMTAAIAVLALSDDLKPHLLNLGVFDVLIPLTESESIEVQGNSAAALGNLSSKVGDYTLFLSSWSQPSGGIHGYLSRFLASEDPTFQHIAIWTLLQLLESGDRRLIETINKADDVIGAVRRISERHVESEDETEDGEDGEGEVVALAKRCLEISSNGGIVPSSGSSVDSGSTIGKMQRT
ncbi:Vacuolar protein 8 [Extremus antarcticus]|uniref:Vacuolar protein 8 n=1 Tax=Extremus antarcticus TaxID=702011 RepID=A0AAJ0LXH2_9PEZI|nr:Vacuolar protein 8 [Extremus antarcticus]